MLVIIFNIHAVIIITIIIQDLTGSVSVVSRPRSESTSSLSSSPISDSLEETVVVHIPSYVQVVDWEIVTTQMKKFTVYCIVSKIEDGGKQ